MNKKDKGDSMAFLSPYTTPPSLEGELGLGVCLTNSAPPYPKVPGGVVDLARILDGHGLFVSTLVAQPGVRMVRLRQDLDDEQALRVVCASRCPPHEDSPGRAARALRAQGLLVTSLSGFAGDHLYGAGFARPHVGLTEKGKDFVRAVADNGGIGDLSHMSRRCIIDTLELTARENLALPLMASHVACSAMYNHGQSLPDEVLLELFARGGYVGIIGLTPLLSASDDSDRPFFQHLLHALKLAQQAGRGLVGLGSDAVYRDRSVVEARRQMNNVLAQFPNHHGDFDEFAGRSPGYPDDWITSGTKIPELVAAGLKRRGVKEPVIDGVVGRNLIDFLSTALPDR